MGDKPDLSDTEAAFYQYIGICISEWANVETQLFRLCAFVLKASTQHVAIVFRRTPTLETRLKLADELVMTVLPKRERQDGGHDAPIVIEWKAIQQEFRELMETRNHLAHWPVVRGTSVKIAMNPSTLDMEILSHEDTLEMSQSLTELHRGTGKKDGIKPTDLPGHHSKVIGAKAESW
jgi:hypothetical protein